MRRFASLALLALAVNGLCGSVRAGDALHRAWCSVKRDWVRANRWPDPYIQPDRELTRAPFGTMVAKGWAAENTLGHHHFTAESKLTDAGRYKLQNIVQNTPEQFRTVVVQRAATPESTAARIASIEEAAQLMIDEGDSVPQVVESNRLPRTSPANGVESVLTKYLNSTPVPRLPAPAGSTSTTSGGSTN